jgi:hypothetical protein
MSAALQNAQIQQLNGHTGRPPQDRDVLSFASQYAYQQKQPTISQRQHSISLQQQIAFAAAQGGNSVAGPSFTEDDLTPKAGTDPQQQSRET